MARRGRRRTSVMCVACLALLVRVTAARVATAQTVLPAKLVLVLGAGASALVPAVRDAGGIAIADLGRRPLSEVSLIVLANIAYPDIPRRVASQLHAFVRDGDALLLTGGRHAYGGGAYGLIQDLVPFRLRAKDDFVVRSFKPPVPLVPIPRWPAAVSGRWAVSTI